MVISLDKHRGYDTKKGMLHMEHCAKSRTTKHESGAAAFLEIGIYSADKRIHLFRGTYRFITIFAGILIWTPMHYKPAILLTA
jgi:hypothetical protein